MAAKRGFNVLKTTAKKGVTIMRRPALALGRSAFQAGLVKCGNQLGKHVVKQVLLSGAKMGVDQGIREAFNALEAKIAELVRLKISTWVDATHGQKMEEIHYTYLFERQGVSAVRLVVHSSKHKLFERQNAGNQMLEDLSRRFADAMASRITEGLEKTENPKLCVVAFCVKALAEGAKWAEVSVQVGKFVDEWLDVVAEAVEDEFQHLRCVDVTAAADELRKWNATQSGTTAGFALHPLGERTHWHPSHLTEIEGFTASESLQDTVPGSRLLLAEARKKMATADGFETRTGVDGGRWKAWETPRNLFVSELVNVATAFIRGKLERRTAEFSNRMAAYGLGKLVDKTADAYLRNKAKRLLSRQPQDEDEAAALDRGIERFMGDNEATHAADKGIDDIVENSPASMGVIHALARKDDLSVVIHHADGTTTVVNPSGSNTPIHMDESGSGRLRHLVPRVSPEVGGSVAFDDSLSNGTSDCMYRAYFFVKSGRNASASEITQYRQQTADHFDINRNERLLLYIHRRPKRVWGGGQQRLGGVPGLEAYERRFLESEESSLEVQQLAAQILSREHSRSERIFLRHRLAQLVLADQNSNQFMAQRYNDAIPPRSYRFEFSHPSINPNFSADLTGTGFAYAGRNVVDVASDPTSSLGQHRLGVFLHPNRGEVLVSSNNRGLAHHGLVSTAEGRFVRVDNPVLEGTSASNYAVWNRRGCQSVQTATFEHSGATANARNVRWGRQPSTSVPPDTSDNTWRCLLCLF
ncbi:hypothetical protein BBJ28_00025450 [Nothophytophthora sp. Chile5]|nr:hypothetical protein BBJ28_00025450 [Nothophytophthora sp. Chile5]